MSGRHGVRGTPTGRLEASIGKGWRVTLPRVVRLHFGLLVGDRIEFVVAPDGRVEVRPIGPYASVRGGAWTGGGRHFIVSD